MIITDKNTLHKNLDEMLSLFSNDMQPKEIGICESLVKYDKDLIKNKKYKGFKLTIFKEWFAKGQIVII